MKSSYPRKPRSDKSFTLEQVLQTALALVDAQGLAALSVRRLAQELGIGPMSLYRYVRTMEEIVEGVYGLALDRLIADVDQTAPWEEQLTAAMRHLHHTLRQHPGILELLLASAGPGPAIDRLRENLLGIFRRGGFPVTDAVKAVGAAVSCVLGFAMSERARATLDSAARLQSLPAEEFPHLHEAASEWQKHVSDDAFEYALTHLIDGMRRDLETADRGAAEPAVGVEETNL